MEVQMKKNVILTLSFLMFLPVLTYGSSGIAKTPLDSNEDELESVEEVQEPSIKDVIPSPVKNSSSIVTIIKDILTSTGHTFAVIGHAIITFGDDGEETENTVEKVGRHVGFFGNFLKKIGDLLKKIY